MKPASKISVVLTVIFAIAGPLQGEPPKPEAVCPKYQHDISFHGVINCHADPDDKSGLLMVCDSMPPQCLDDVHVLTEKEWQALAEHLYRLDHPAITSTGEAVTGSSWISDGYCGAFSFPCTVTMPKGTTCAEKDDSMVCEMPNRHSTPQR